MTPPEPSPESPASYVSCVDFLHPNRGKSIYLRSLTSVPSSSTNQSFQSDMSASTKAFMPIAQNNFVIVKPRTYEIKFLHMLDHHFKYLDGKFIHQSFEDRILPPQVGPSFDFGALNSHMCTSTYWLL